MIFAKSSRFWWPEAIILVGLLTAVPMTNAQKKGSSAPSAAASPAASGAGATASNAPFEVEMLSYGALDQILQKLGDYSCKQHINGDTNAGVFDTVVVLDSPTLQNLQAFDSFYANAETLISAFDTMTSKAGAGGGIDDFADITNAVVAAATSSNSEASFTFTIQDPTVAIALLHHLQSSSTSKGCQDAYYGGVYSVNEVTGAKINGKDLNTVSQELDRLARTRSTALKFVVGQYKPAPAVGALPCLATPTVAAGASAGNTPIYAVSSQDPCVAAFNNLDGTYNSFLAGLSAPNSTSGLPAFASILQGYRLRALFGTATETKPILAIYLNVAVAGGTQQDRKNLITALFTGDWIRYSGGVSVNVIVFQIGGKKSKILFSDLLRYRTPLKTISKPKGYNGAGSAGDNLDDLP